jgi:hypothetical protein
MPTGHDCFGHATDGLLHRTSQAHDWAQSIEGHACSPEHRISHSPAPQLMAPHDDGPEQSMSQLCAPAQSTSPHAPVVLHRMVQSYPGGQRTAAHGSLASHTIRHVMSSRSQSSQPSGHWLLARVTQNPSTHTRLLRQSLSSSHANASDCRCTLQLAATAATAAAISTASAATHLVTACPSR